MPGTRSWRAAPRSLPLIAAVGVYLAWAVVLAEVGPGLHYDEALFQVGAVQMLATSGPPTFTRPPFAWLPAGGRFWPVMVMPYAGAVGDYLLWPAFALFGTGPVVGRLVAALLAGFGLWGLGRLLDLAAGPAAAGAAVLLLAVHPGFLSNTVFNDSGFTYWVAALGGVALALRRYVVCRTAAWAAVLGLACGLGVWARLNFVWLLAAALLGALVGFGRRGLPPRRHLAAAAAGALTGAAPLLAWQLLTRFRATLGFLSDFDTGPRTVALLALRLRQLSSALLYDDEHRFFMWEGPPLPAWEVALVCVLAVAAVASAFVGRDAGVRCRFHRALAVAVLAQVAVMLLARLPVREHHFLTLVPLLAVCAVLAGARLLAGRPRAWPLAAAAAVLYLGLALHWDWAIRRGLVATGGTGVWSEANTAVARYLESRPGPPVRVLDWGFDTCIRVTTRGRVEPRELFWSFFATHPVTEPAWRKEIEKGGLYLTHAPAYLTPMGAAATARFQQALARSGLGYSRLVFNDRRGRPHSELVEVAP